MADPDGNLDRMLAEAGERIQAPPGLQRRVEGEIDRSIWQRRAFGGAAAGLVVVLIALVWGSGWPPTAPYTPPRSGGTIAQEPGDPNAPPGAQLAEATVAGAPGAVVRMNDPTVFAAPVQSSRPNVTIVRVYRDMTVEDPSPGSRNQDTPASEAPVWTADYGE